MARGQITPSIGDENRGQHADNEPRRELGEAGVQPGVAGGRGTQSQDGAVGRKVAGERVERAGQRGHDARGGGEHKHGKGSAVVTIIALYEATLKRAILNDDDGHYVTDVLHRLFAALIVPAT